MCCGGICQHCVTVPAGGVCHVTTNWRSSQCRCTALTNDTQSVRYVTLSCCRSSTQAGGFGFTVSGRSSTALPGDCLCMHIIDGIIQMSIVYRSRSLSNVSWWLDVSVLSGSIHRRKPRFNPSMGVGTKKIHSFMGVGNYSDTSNNMKLVQWPLMGVQLHLMQRWGDWARQLFIFLPRDAYAYGGLCRGKMSVCLSVCLSVSRRYCG